MDTPTVKPTPQPTANTDAGQVVMPNPKPSPKGWLKGIFSLAILICAIAIGYYGWIWYDSSQNSTETTGDTATSTPAQTDDVVAAQLKSVSDKSDTSTIMAEITDTPTSDITVELDNIDAEATGL